MADDDDFMMEDEAEEDYGFEYESDGGEEAEVGLENQYYNAKALKEDAPAEAREAFLQLLAQQDDSKKGDWGFKALKQLVKLSFKQGKLDDVLNYYEQMLTYIKSAVTRNYSEKSIHNLLDFISTSADIAFLERFYTATLTALDDAKNERVWFRTNQKLGQLMLDRGEYTKLTKILRQLMQSCQTDDGEDDGKKGTQLLEVYALEIQMYTATKNNKKLEDLYQRSLKIKSAIPHPRILGVIRECGGKMYMMQSEYTKANQDFFEAFKNYDETGSPRRIQCLKYLVLSNMLMMSEIDPFTAQETQPYKNDPEILAMTRLVTTYQQNSLFEFEKILRDNRKTIMEDPFIRNYIEELLKNIRTQVLLNLIKPYTKIDIRFICQELRIPYEEAEALLVSLILDGRVAGLIDEVGHCLELKKRPATDSKYESLSSWAKQLEKLQISLSNNTPVY